MAYVTSADLIPLGNGSHCVKLHLSDGKELSIAFNRHDSLDSIHLYANSVSSTPEAVLNPTNIEVALNLSDE